MRHRNALIGEFPQLRAMRRSNASHRRSMISFAVSDTCRKRVLFTSLSVSKSNTLSEMSLTRCSTASLVGRSRWQTARPRNDFNTCECSVCLAAISFASFSTSLLFSNVFASASRCLILAKTEALSSLSVVGTIIEGRRHFHANSSSATAANT